MIGWVLVAAASVAVLGFAATPLTHADAPYANCSQARADGRSDIPQGDPDYWPGGDRNGDGIAGES